MENEDEAADAFTRKARWTDEKGTVYELSRTGLGGENEGGLEGKRDRIGLSVNMMLANVYREGSRSGLVDKREGGGLVVLSGIECGR